jgi:hypothetical protein
MMKQMTEINAREVKGDNKDAEFIKNKRLESIQKRIEAKDESMMEDDQDMPIERNKESARGKKSGDEANKKRGSRKDKYRV